MASVLSDALEDQLFYYSYYDEDTLFMHFHYMCSLRKEPKQLYITTHSFSLLSALFGCQKQGLLNQMPQE